MVQDITVYIIDVNRLPAQLIAQHNVNNIISYKHKLLYYTLTNIVLLYT